MKNFKWAAICLFLIGCTTVDAVGTKTWYYARLDELREARMKDQITTEKYLEFKAEADRIRLEYVNESQRRSYESYYYTRPRFSYGFGYCNYHSRHHHH
ncbi:MAG: hypothetical protein AB7S78_07365 [Candidatus Omnitrophota bacterium]